MIDKLFDEVRSEQDSLLARTDASNEVMRRLLTQNATRARASRRAIGWGWAAAAAVLVASGIAGAWLLHRPSALTYLATTDGMQSGDGYISTRTRGVLDFSDSSRVELFDESAARVVDLRAEGAALALDHGSLEASVRHREGTRWRVYAGPYAVMVTGTRFRVQWDNAKAELSVRVKEGSVRIVGSCMTGARDVPAGQAATLRCTAVATVDAAGPNPNPSPSPSPSPNPNPSPSPSPSPNPPSDLASRIDDAERASLAGDIVAARRLLLDVRARGASSNEGAFAAFLLGRLAFDSQHDFEEAARWFAIYELTSPDGPLIREAMGRHLEALVRLHNTEGAQELAQLYLARFPDGPHAAMAREQSP